ncbi:MAG: hypothetical protein J6A54_06115 [Clostridia bacterium]|nr:hypothetical protein [Clostridia bacterium]
MERSGYRETLAFISEMFPGRLTLKVKEVAQVMSVCENTVRQAISRNDDPLPSQKLVSGTIIVPVPQLARWLSGERRYYGR